MGRRFIERHKTTPNNILRIENERPKLSEKASSVLSRPEAEKWRWMIIALGVAALAAGKKYSTERSFIDDYFKDPLRLERIMNEAPLLSVDEWWEQLITWGLAKRNWLGKRVLLPTAISEL